MKTTIKDPMKNIPPETLDKPLHVERPTDRALEPIPTTALRPSSNEEAGTTNYRAIVAETHVILTSCVITAGSIDEAVAKALSGDVLEHVVIGSRGVLDRTVEAVKIFR